MYVCLCVCVCVFLVVARLKNDPKLKQHLLSIVQKGEAANVRCQELKGGA